MMIEQAKAKVPGLPVVCPIWHRLGLRIVEAGIEYRCRSCSGELHIVSWAEIDQKRRELGDAATRDLLMNGREKTS